MNSKPDVSHLPYPYIGDTVLVAQKKDYVTGKLTQGIVREILTSVEHHPRGTKVRLDSGEIGRIQSFVIHEGKPFVETKNRQEEIIVTSDSDVLV